MVDAQESYNRRWNELENMRQRAIKDKNLDEECKIEERMHNLSDYNTPVTLGHLNYYIAQLKAELQSGKGG